MTHAARVLFAVVVGMIISQGLGMTILLGVKLATTKHCRKPCQKTYCSSLLSLSSDAGDGPVFVLISFCSVDARRMFIESRFVCCKV